MIHNDPKDPKARPAEPESMRFDDSTAWMTDRVRLQFVARVFDRWALFCRDYLAFVAEDEEILRMLEHIVARLYVHVSCVEKELANRCNQHRETEQELH
jgi:hypothetical protein